MAKWEAAEKAAYEEVEQIRAGLKTFDDIEKELYLSTKSDEEKKLDSYVRQRVFSKELDMNYFLKPNLPDYDLWNRNGRIFKMPKIVKRTKVTEKDKQEAVENLDLKRQEVKKAKRFRERMDYSMKKTTMIEKERLGLVKQRLKEYFGQFKIVWYTEGFRYLENIENYQAVYPDRTVSDYLNESI